MQGLVKLNRVAKLQAEILTCFNPIVKEEPFDGEEEER